MKKFHVLALLFTSLMCAQTPNVVPASAPATPAVAAPAPATSTTPAPATNPVQRLSLMISATDVAGNPVANLSKSQLSIMDNGHLAAVSDFHHYPTCQSTWGSFSWAE